jgi:hypothetical protein
MGGPFTYVSVQMDSLGARLMTSSHTQSKMSDITEVNSTIIFQGGLPSALGS